MIESLTITMHLVDAKVDLEAFVDVFGKGKITKIKTSCDNDSNVYNVAFYRFEKLGYKPLYISRISSWAINGLYRSLDFSIAYKQDVAMLSTLDSVPCKAFK